MPQASFDFGYVGPNQASRNTLSSGVYSLSSRSNVPYVALVGRSGFFKIFSWGEIVEIPKNEQCTVKNASFHGGDIFINAGADYDNRPARITVPVPIKSYPLGDFFYFTTEYPGDVRLARRAYLYMDGLGPVSITVVGKRFDGSHNTENRVPFAGLDTKGTGYEFGIVLPAGEIGLLPLGLNSHPYNDLPMVLLTTAQAYLESAVLNSEAGYYVMEY